MGDFMNWKRCFSSQTWCKNTKKYKIDIELDQLFFLTWAGRSTLTIEDKNSVELTYLRCFRKAQANKDSVWGKWYYNKKLARLTRKTGIWIPSTVVVGKGMIIAHWGRIIINPRTVIGDEFSVSSGVLIGRDIRGKRAGVPVLGNRVCIKSGAVVVGNVRIGNDVLIAPNAYVNFDVPDHSIVLGNPAKVFFRENATEGYLGDLQ